MCILCRYFASCGFAQQSIEQGVFRAEDAQKPVFLRALFKKGGTMPAVSVAPGSDLAHGSVMVDVIVDPADESHRTNRQ